MYLTSEKRNEIISKHQKSSNDTGSTKVQIIIFSFKIKHLTEHLKLNKKDHNAKRSLMIIIGKRRGMLKYLLRKTSYEEYKNFIAELEIRK